MYDGIFYFFITMFIMKSFYSAIINYFNKIIFLTNYQFE